MPGYPARPKDEGGRAAREGELYGDARGRKTRPRRDGYRGKSEGRDIGSRGTGEAPGTVQADWPDEELQAGRRTVCWLGRNRPKDRTEKINLGQIWDKTEKSTLSRDEKGTQELT